MITKDSFVLGRGRQWEVSGDLICFTLNGNSSGNISHISWINDQFSGQFTIQEMCLFFSVITNWGYHWLDRNWNIVFKALASFQEVTIYLKGTGFNLFSFICLNKDYPNPGLLFPLILPNILNIWGHWRTERYLLNVMQQAFWPTTVWVAVECQGLSSPRFLNK